MTICVAFNGIIAGDSWVSDSQSNGYAGTIKLHPIRDVVYTVGDKKLKVLWYACSGVERSCMGMLNILKGTGEKAANINAIADMLRIVEPIHTSNFTGLFLLEDGSSLVLNERGRMTHRDKDRMALIGSGCKLFKSTKRLQDAFTAPQVAWIISKLAIGCGGPIHYAELGNEEIKIYKPTKETIKKIQAFVNAELLIE